MNIPVLDHGYVKLIDSCGTEESIIEAARQSTGKGFQGWSKDAQLLEYLYKNKHSSPFEMCDLVIEVHAPLFVLREWQRHRTFSYNEFSARYSEMIPLYYAPGVERIVKQSPTNKQGSGAEPLRIDIAEKFARDFMAEQDEADRQYREKLAHGLVREVARVNVPVSIYSQMRAKGNLRNWLHFLGLRLADNAQWEIRQFAQAVAIIVANKWPRTYALFEEWDLHGVRLSRTEAEEWKKWKASRASAT